MKKLKFIFGALLCFGLSTVYAAHHMQETTPKAQALAMQQIDADLLVENARAKATIPGIKVSAGYLKLSNKSNQTMRFIGATTDAAKYTEFHKMVMDDGKMVMRKVQTIQIKPQQSFVFKEKGYHFMFIGLNQRFTPGESISLILIRDNKQTYKIILPIIEMQQH